MRKSVSVPARYFKHWFPKRNVIIVSEKKVKHVPIGGKTQLSVVTLLIGGICWASYFTGSYLSARSIMKAQRQTIRSVASARVATNFSSLFPPSVVVAEKAENDPTVASLTDPIYSLSALDHNKLFARIAFLEQQVMELKTANEAIIHRVSDKALSSIGDIESIIRQTGLHVGELTRQFNDRQASEVKPGTQNAEGGPFIPDSITVTSPQELAMYDDLDRLTALREILGELPLGVPIANANEDSPFGRRIDPFTGRLAFHPGVDLAGPVGSKIYSTADGTVAFAGPNGGYGNSVDIDHGFGLMTRYGHMSKILVTTGQTVHKGDVIGIQGSTGRSTGPHLHYEVRYHGQLMNPVNFLEAGRYVSQK